MFPGLDQGHAVHGFSCERPHEETIVSYSVPFITRIQFSVRSGGSASGCSSWVNNGKMLQPGRCLYQRYSFNHMMIFLALQFWIGGSKFGWPIVGVDVHGIYGCWDFLEHFSTFGPDFIWDDRESSS